MPHISITMIPGRSYDAKKKIAKNVQEFMAQELQIDSKFVTVSIEDIPKEDWELHMEQMKEKEMFTET